MAGDNSKYVNRITLEHSDKPKFMATVGATVQPFSDMIQLASSEPTLYDIDTAVGAQLDAIGKWVGVSRDLKITLPNSVYFSFDIVGLGFDQGVWADPNQLTGIVTLPDFQYRLLLKAKIMNNHWDCDMPDAYALSDAIFAPIGYHLFIDDHADLTMDLGLIGPSAPDALTWALFTSGLFNLRPAGVKINYYYSQTAPGPLFAFDLSTSYFAGFDQGSWAQLTVVP